MKYIKKWKEALKGIIFKKYSVKSDSINGLMLEVREAYGVENKPLLDYIEASLGKLPLGNNQHYFFRDNNYYKLKTDIEKIENEKKSVTYFS